MGVLASVAILVPMLGRPHRVVPLLESIEASTSDYRVLFLCTSGDTAVIEAIETAGSDHLEVGYRRRGDYARKINHGFTNSTEPLLFLGADDLRFHANWFERAFDKMTRRVGVVGTNDLGNARVLRGEHATHSLVSRSYVDEFGTIDEPGKILHEGYWHEYCDDELVGTAKKRKAWAFASDSLVEHLHPQFHKAPWDASYEAQAERMRYSRRVFERRRALWT